MNLGLWGKGKKVDLTRNEQKTKRHYIKP